MQTLDIIEPDLTELEGPAPVVQLFKSKKATRKRRAKVSRVPQDYDPFANTMALPEGYQRPPQKCWVPQDVARLVSISELSPLWREDLGEMGTSDRKHRFLASVVAMVNGEYYVRKKSSGLWVHKKKMVEVKNVLWNDWGGDQTELNIRKDTLDTFFSEGSYLVLDNVAYVPGAGCFVEFNGQTCLNTYHQPPLAFRPQDPISAETILLIEMIVRNLLGYCDGELPDWLNAIHDNEPSSIRWCFHYLASLYQRPGKSLPVAMWFVGSGQGVGKGLLTSALQKLVGQKNAKVVSAEEFKGEWTDFLTNTSLMILDEVDFASRQDANNKLKRLVGNDRIAVRKRNLGEYMVPAVANFVFTTNNVRPIALDRGDRRNTFFETNASGDSKRRAKQFYSLSESAKVRAIEGLAEILNGIDIDDDLLSRAIDTDIKRRMIDAGADPFYEWFHTDEVLGRWLVGEFAPVSWIKDRYLSWAKEKAPRGCTTNVYAQTKIDELVSEGYLSIKIRKRLNDDSRPYGYIRYDPASEEAYPDPASCEVIKPLRKDKGFIQMRDRVEKNRRTA
jgi:hypothetical protein